VGLARLNDFYSYLNGNRNITGNKGARLLAQYFYRRGDFAMVSALSQLTLGIPYPAPNGGSDNWHCPQKKHPPI
jgi:hypothetical protein